jgi:A/G-specific adenine glycosylase
MAFKHKKFFTRQLLEWHQQSHRPLPWKGIRDPYLIWLSEIILQQTRAEQGLPYYKKFKQAYPSVFDMAEAHEDEIMKLWQGLGYYSRARNMHFTARHIANELNGRFPETVEGLQKLKGVGPYTAAAIASFAFDKKAAVLDGNVYRVLSRFFGIKKAIDDNDARKYFGALAQQLVPAKDPGRYNQAIMDLGATVCTPKKYSCDSCYLKEKCTAFHNGEVDNLPVKNKKIKRRTRYFNYFIIQENTSILIRKRTDKDIWQHLYEFPLFESAKPIKTKTSLLKGLSKIPFEFKNSSINFNLLQTYNQQLTHQKIVGSFWIIQAEGPLNIRNEFIWADGKNLSNFAFPRIVSLFLEDNFLHLGK